MRGVLPRSPRSSSATPRHRSERRIVMHPSSDSAVVANPVAALRQYGQSRAEAPGAGGRPRRRYVQPRDLREGHRRQRRLRIGDSGDLRPAARPRRQGRVRAARDQGHPGRRRRASSGVRSHRVARRLRQPRGVAGPGEQHEPHPGGSTSALDDGRAAQRDDQGARDAGRAAGNSHADQRRDQRQRDTAVRP